jgi:hypothetical protein
LRQHGQGGCSNGQGSEQGGRFVDHGRTSVWVR